MARRGGCVLNGCLAVLMTALVLVLLGMWRLSTASGRADGRARERMKESVEQTRDLLSQAASDGSLLGTEIDRSTRGGNGKASAAEVQRHGRRVTVTEPFAIVEGGWYSGSASGCYRFDLVPASSPPPVSVHELSDALCRDRSATTRYRDPAAVAADVVVELRAAVTRGGLTGVQNASVWQTGGIVRTGQETKHGQLITLALLSRGLGPADRDCYEFRAGEKPVTVTTRKLGPDGCDRIRREQQARAAAALRAELEAGSRQIEHRLERAVADGTLTDAELKRALALQQTDEGREVSFDAPVAVSVRVRRSPSEVDVVAKVNALDINHTSTGCYEFRAHLAKQSVTRRPAAETDCLG
ncbi:hypothetical protein [Streptomyces sp. NBC_01615]|uniref:hypothetical protein n=1 Tax=Streptomyces sp. NBC_01615 TaxID=2975898 RepID=UPI00386B41A3